MASRSRRLHALTLSCVVASTAAAASPAQADKRPPAGAAPSSSSSQPDANGAEAKKHFDKARELYRQGSYREAIVELEAALKLDPTGKELVYNLGVLHEKLQDIDDALKYFRQYAQMDLTPEERDKTEAAIRRLEGAKKEVEQKKAEEEKKRQQQQQQQDQPPPPPVAYGRIDVATIATAGVAVVGLGLGTVLGIKALSDKPPAGSHTDKNNPYSTLQQRTDTAFRESVMADISLGVGVVAAGVTAYLYFARPKEPPAPPQTGARVSVAVSPGGAAVLVGGSF